MPLLGQLCQFQVINGQNEGIGGIILDGKTIIVGERPVSVLHCAPQIQLGLGWSETHVSAVRSGD